jgi:uncharacterized protein (TIGR00251 family)
MDVPTARVRLRVVPGGRRAGVVGRHGDGWRVRVTAPPERGRATEEVLQLLADVLELRRRDVRVVAGTASRDKVVEVRGVDAAAAAQRLGEAAG